MDRQREGRCTREAERLFRDPEVVVPLRRGIGGSHTKSEISFDTLRLVSADTRTLSKSNDAFKYIDCLFFSD